LLVCHHTIMFLNRSRELSFLDNRYARPAAEFVVMYGRRRVGKSSLLYEWCQGKPFLYFFAARLPEAVLLHEFSQQVAQALGQPERSFPDWSALFSALAELGREQRFIVVIDEYPYLADSSPGLSTVLQRAWDTTLQYTKLFLCLAGSNHSVMRRELLDGHAPLYRRHTWAFELQPLQPSDYRAFFPTYSAQQMIEAYAVLGGMPRNLVTINRETSLLRNVTNEILDPAGSLFNEVPLLLHEELKGEVDSYSRVLEVIASGAHTRHEIAALNQTTLSATQHYLNELLAIGILEHRRPLSRLQEQRQQGTYHILDPFLRFWHRWVAPQRRLLEINQRQSETLSEIRNQLPQIVAPIWEMVARQHLLVASGQGQIPFAVQEVGSWWARNAQVDLVGVNRYTRQVVFGEVRWRSTAVTQKDVDVLMEKSLLWLHGDSARWEVHYAFFAKAFTDTVDADDFVHCFLPEDVTDLA
jgi:AAA+ ATPase superfamily predicted ATPase